RPPRGSARLWHGRGDGRGDPHLAPADRALPLRLAERRDRRPEAAGGSARPPCADVVRPGGRIACRYSDDLLGLGIRHAADGGAGRRPRRGARGAPAGARPAMRPAAPAAVSQPAAAPRKLVGKSSAAQVRTIVILPPWKKTIAANPGQSARAPPRKKSHSASV